MVGSVLNAIKAIGALHAPAVFTRLNDLVRGRRRASSVNGLGRARHQAVLVRRRARLMNHASVSGTLTNNAAPIKVAGDGSLSALVN
jgi:hypothetical protein